MKNVLQTAFDASTGDWAFLFLKLAFGTLLAAIVWGLVWLIVTVLLLILADMGITF